MTGCREYRRARTEEQKDQRLTDILDVTEALLDERHYREITMAAIAERLGYSRANLSHYVRSKEEILLLLYVRSLHEMLADMEAIRPAALSGEVEEAAKRLAGLVVKHEDFGRIGALLASLVESNVSLECLVSCKRQILEAMDKASELLVKHGFFWDREHAADFLVDLSNYAAGLYPASHPLPIQLEAARVAGYPVPGYRESLERYIVIQLFGYQVLT